MVSIKKICVITGTRAEYGPLKLLLQKIEQSKKLELILIVTGMHLLKKYGNTIDLIKDDGIKISKIIPMYDEDDDLEDSLGRAVGKAICSLTVAFIEIKPDLLLVAGDRFESLAGVIAASTLSIPIAHIQGGDTNERGQVDEQIRHSITKFAHLHFPATAKSQRVIELMGENPERIYNCGAIALDMVYQIPLLNKDEVCEQLQLDAEKKIIVCLQHPYTFEAEKAGEYIRLILKVLKEIEIQTLIIYPNNDPGSELIIKEIDSVKKLSWIKTYKNIERILYLSLLKNSDLLVGNSSSGLIESPIFKLPVVNIGDRNKGRESGHNVIDVKNDYDEIKNAILKALSNQFKQECKNVINPYGNGTASDKIVEILEQLEITDDFIRKKLNYNV